MPFLAIKSLLSRVQLVYNSITGQMMCWLDIPNLSHHICVIFYHCCCCCFCWSGACVKSECLCYMLHLLSPPDVNVRNQSMPMLLPVKFARNLFFFLVLTQKKTVQMFRSWCQPCPYFKNPSAKPDARGNRCSRPSGEGTSTEKRFTVDDVQTASASLIK